MSNLATAQPAEKATPLKPCPFCGVRPALINKASGNHMIEHSLTCFLIETDPKQVIFKSWIPEWNTRAQSAAVDAAVAALTRIAHIDLDTAEATHTEAGSLFSAVSAARAALKAVDNVIGGDKG